MTKLALHKAATKCGGWAKISTLALLALSASFLSGCVASAGYGGGYYAPSYTGYYRDYGYAGGPYWGGGPYIGSAIIVGGRRHRGYYGGHHYSHDFRRRGAGFHSRGSRGSAHWAGGRRGRR